MINFFRRIRQKLLTENKFSKYLIYAIGEIILVVIGILIALQINNWNESKKNQIILRNYKERLIRQFEADSIFLKKIKGGYGFVEPKLKKLDSLFRQNLDGNVSKDSIIKVPIFITLQSEFISATTVIDELFNTGNLDLFENDELKDLLAGYKKSITQQHDIIARSKNKFDDFDTLLHQVSRYSESEYLIRAGNINSDFFMNEYWFINASREGQQMLFNEIMEMNNHILVLLKEK
jgi:hypothetical protein